MSGLGSIGFAGLIDFIGLHSWGLPGIEGSGFRNFRAEHHRGCFGCRVLGDLLVSGFGRKGAALKQALQYSLRKTPHHIHPRLHVES